VLIILADVSLGSLESDCTKEPSTTSTGKTPPTEPLTRSERRAVLMAAAILVGLIAIGATVWAVVTSSSGANRPTDKCVTLAVASSMGGGVEHACGDAARTWCQAAYTQQNPHAQAVQVQCRGAGILP
jgi:hypothetical protein